MKAPNVLSVAVIVAVIALAQGLAEQLPLLGEPWVPFAVVALGAVVKGLQVILQDQQRVMTPADDGSRLRRWLLE